MRKKAGVTAVEDEEESRGNSGREDEEKNTGVTALEDEEENRGNSCGR